MESTRRQFVLATAASLPMPVFTASALFRLPQAPNPQPNPMWAQIMAKHRRVYQ